MARRRLRIKVPSTKTSTKASCARDPALPFLWCRIAHPRWANKASTKNLTILDEKYFGPCEAAWILAKSRLERASLPVAGLDLRLLPTEDIFVIRRWNSLVSDALYDLAPRWDQAWADARSRLGRYLLPRDSISLEQLRHRHNVTLMLEPPETCPLGKASVTLDELDQVVAEHTKAC